MDEYIIKCQNISYIYDDSVEENSHPAFVTPAVDNVSFSVRRGEYVAILGHNGSGKSTLAKLLNMILSPTGGKIFINNVDITDENLSEDDIFALRSKVGMVFQNPDNQLVATVVEEDVAFGPENLGIPREEIRKRVDEALSVVGMTEYKDFAPHKLSGGQKQRVAIAGIIAMMPNIIIFDEATAMLDPIGRKDVLSIMEKLNRDENITVLNITHYMDEAARADRIIVVNDGKLLLDGTPSEIFSDVELLHNIGLEAPQGTELIHELNKHGFTLNPSALSEEDCVMEIMKLLSGGSNE